MKLNFLTAMSEIRLLDGQLCRHKHHAGQALVGSIKSGGYVNSEPSHVCNSHSSLLKFEIIKRLCVHTYHTLESICKKMVKKSDKIMYN